MNGTLVFLTPDKYREVKTEALRKKRGLRWPTQTKGGRSI
jgi:hypothetical protein